MNVRKREKRGIDPEHEYREGKKQEKRRALLDAAYELFLERGTAKTSVEDITSRAKVAKGTFYLYFQDKGR